MSLDWNVMTGELRLIITIEERLTRSLEQADGQAAAQASRQQVVAERALRQCLAHYESSRG